MQFENQLEYSKEEDVSLVNMRETVLSWLNILDRNALQVMDRYRKEV